MNILIMSFNLTNLFCQGSGKADESFAEKPALKKAQYQFLSSTITTSADDQTKDNESRRLLENITNFEPNFYSEAEGYRYDQCDYAATTTSNLQRHKQSKHVGIRYPCDQCDYTATVYGALKQHKA